LSNAVLKELFDGLAAIEHVTLLRLHTRFPLGIPERIDQSFLELLSATRLQAWMVIHCNHPNELDADVLRALKEVQKRGVPVLNQAVLLRGVNDTFEVQKALHERLADHGIIPYYLHQLDRVLGTAHFEVPQEEGVALIQELRNFLPGYAVPRYAAEIPGRLSKTILA
jgi:KamA family protein